MFTRRSSLPLPSSPYFTFAPRYRSLSARIGESPSRKSPCSRPRQVGTGPTPPPPHHSIVPRLLAPRCLNGPVIRLARKFETGDLVLPPLYSHPYLYLSYENVSDKLNFGISRFILFKNVILNLADR